MRYSQRYRRLTTVAALVTALLVVAQFVACSSRKKQAVSAKLPPLPALQSNQTFASEMQEPRGVAAVRPTKVGAIPAFAPEDLSNFVLTHPVPGVGQLEQQPKVTTLDCSYTATRLAAVLRNKSTGLPADIPFCYVELQGKFAVRTPPSKKNPRPNPLVFTKSFEVFDARTGNLLLSGGFIRP
jgi:hypothetical protein